VVQQLSLIFYSIDRNEIKFVWELSVTNKSIIPNRKQLSVFRVETRGRADICSPIMRLFNKTSARKEHTVIKSILFFLNILALIIIQLLS
jgi:hypothetical protein